jgi:hypothetical protein
LHLTIFETITINNHCYGIAPIWLAGENIYLGESALHVDNSDTLSSMNNGGDAGNRNPRKTSLYIPIGLNSQSITQLELPRSRLSLAFPLSVHEVVPNPYQIEPPREFGFLIACEIMTR